MESCEVEATIASHREDIERGTIEEGKKRRLSLCGSATVGSRQSQDLSWCDGDGKSRVVV